MVSKSLGSGHACKYRGVHNLRGMSKRSHKVLSFYEKVTVCDDKGERIIDWDSPFFFFFGATED